MTAWRGGRLWSDPTDRITLIAGDSLDVLETLPACGFAAVITDPPYSSGGQFRGDRAVVKSNRKYQRTNTVRTYPEIVGDTRDQRGWFAWSVLWLRQCARVLEAGGVVAVFADWRQVPTATDALQAAGFVWRGLGAWDKTGQCRPTMGRYAAQAEYIVWGSKGAMPFDRGVPPLPGVWSVPVAIREKQHVTEKPVGLMRELVRIARPGGRVLDPFCGAGSTVVAAALEGYAATGIEVVDEYVDRALVRVSTALQVAAPVSQVGLFEADHAGVTDGVR